MINFTDQGDYSIMDAFEAKKRIDGLPAEQRQSEWKKLMETHPGDANRIVLGRAADTSAVLKMRDPRARPAGHQGGGRRFTEHSILDERAES